MGKKVLEDSGSIDQIVNLLDRLEGNQAFARLRGKMDQTGKEVLGPFGRVLGDSKNPSQFCKSWDQFTSDSRVIGNLLAQLRRDGQERAFDELSRSLYNQSFTFSGEVVPVHETTPLTIVVIDFEKVKTMIQWICTDHWTNLRRHYYGHQSSKLTKELFTYFPRLTEYVPHFLQRYEGHELVAALLNHVCCSVSKDAMNWLEAVGQKLNPAHMTYNDHLEVGGSFNEPTFCWAIWADQAEVLSHFTREEQKIVSTWLIQVPKRVKVAMQNGRDMTRIGFHPEDQHEEWKNEPSAFRSVGCQNGYGVVLLVKWFESVTNDTYSIGSCHKYIGRYHKHGTYGAGYDVSEGETFSFLLDGHYHDKE